MTRLENLRSLLAEQVFPAFRARQLAETREHYVPLFEHLLALTPPTFSPQVAHMVTEICARTDGERV